MKKILVLFAVFISLSSCVSNSEYKKKLESTLTEMVRSAAFAGVTVSSYQDVWRTAIYDNEYRGAYCSDFNEALGDYIPKTQELDSYKTALSSFVDMEDRLRELQKAPSKYRGAHDEMIILYTHLSELWSHAKWPNGSLQSFSEDIRRLDKEIAAKSKEIRLKYLND